LVTAGLKPLLQMTQWQEQSDKLKRPYILVDLTGDWRKEALVLDRTVIRERVPINLQIRLDGTQRDALYYMAILKNHFHTIGTSLATAIATADPVAGLVDFNINKTTVEVDYEVVNRPGWLISLEYLADFNLTLS
jgi:hypothetical protein